MCVFSPRGIGFKKIAPLKGRESPGQDVVLCFGHLGSDFPGQHRALLPVLHLGTPDDPGVDPIDWVERIPFTETRNYVQRVLENLQVYRVKFGGGTKLLMGADLRRGSATQN